LRTLCSWSVLTLSIVFYFISLCQDAITIFKGDLKKLAPEEYLNDNLIDLKIKHLAATQLTQAQAAAIHVFNCMFYTCLTTPKSPEQGHKVVSRWTNKVDLFAKDYIIIPINYSYHWSLAVIIRPGAIKVTIVRCVCVSLIVVDLTVQICVLGLFDA